MRFQTKMQYLKIFIDLAPENAGLLKFVFERAVFKYTLRQSVGMQNLKVSKPDILR